jgi:hypothetical protein
MALTQRYRTLGNPSSERRPNLGRRDVGLQMALFNGCIGCSISRTSFMPGQIAVRDTSWSATSLSSSPRRSCGFSLHRGRRSSGGTPISGSKERGLKQVGATADVAEVWFSGAHCDITGGSGDDGGVRIPANGGADTVSLRPCRSPQFLGTGARSAAGGGPPCLPTISGPYPIKSPRRQSKWPNRT